MLMKIRAFFLGVGAAIVACAPMAALAAPIIYTVSDTVLEVVITGAITTDGASGVLSKSDILDWNLNLTFVPSDTLTKSNGTVSITGSDLTASGNHLFFNFGDNNPATAGQFEFSNTTTGSAWGAQSLYVCGGPCVPGDAGVEFAGLDLMFTGDTYFSDQEAIATSQEFVTPATPIPAALPLFATGLGMMGLFGWCRNRRAAAIAA
jgi:hypothetical protein